MIDESLLEIRQYSGEGYRPLIDYKTWRVAILKYCDELLPENITKVQRHNETDEVFVLLQGECTLFLGAGKETVTKIFPQKLEPLKLYNVKKAVWHTHTLSKEAVVLIVENQDTTTLNSDEILLTEEQREEIIRFTSGK
ncbi:MAG: hypothetical protein ACM3X9_04085 [Bacillota bacterium]